MPDYWLDADTLITPYRQYYSFDKVPKFWEFLEQKAGTQIIASPLSVLEELKDGGLDQLCTWAIPLEGKLFIAPNNDVQLMNTQVSDYIKNNKKYHPQWVQDFLSGADTWVIAHTKIMGGRIVTFEELAGQNSKRVKIPDVADHFGVKCINLFKMLDDLKAHF